MGIDNNFKGNQIEKSQKINYANMSVFFFESPNYDAANIKLFTVFLLLVSILVSGYRT